MYSKLFSFSLPVRQSCHVTAFFAKMEALAESGSGIQPSGLSFRGTDRGIHLPHCHSLGKGNPRPVPSFPWKRESPPVPSFPLKRESIFQKINRNPPPTRHSPTCLPEEALVESGSGIQVYHTNNIGDYVIPLAFEGDFKLLFTQKSMVASLLHREK